MKFILFKLNDTNKTIINDLQTGNIKEITLSKKMLNERLNRKPKGISKLKNAFYDNSLRKKILKALKPYDKKWYYLLSKEFNFNESNYLVTKAQELLGYKFNVVGEMDKNIVKYIDEYVASRSVKKHEIRCLVICSNLSNLSFDVIKRLIKEYKTVNIYLNEKPTNYIIKQINKINKEEGTTIELVKKEKKQLTEFNVVYFVDDVKESYPRLRLNKKALIIDLNVEDKFNSNIMFLKGYITENNIESEKIRKYIDEYGLLEFASIVKKIVN